MSKKEIITGIYKITNPKGKVYIGQSYNIKDRLFFYKNSLCKGQRKIYNSIKKYGWDAHLFEIIHICDINVDKKELNDLESYYEELYDSTKLKTGLNLRKCGGSKGRHSEETKKLIGAANKIAYANPNLREICRKSSTGNKNFLGKKHSEKTKKKISISNSGEKNGMFGKKLSDSAREKISKIHKGNKYSLGKKRSQEAILKGSKSISLAWKKKQENGTSSKLILLNIENGIYYFGIKSASDASEINFGYLNNMVSGRSRNKTSFIKVN